MGIKILTYITGLIILVMVAAGCTQGNSGVEEAQVTATSTEVSVIEVADISQPTVSPTPLSTVVAGQALQVYKTMLLTQVTAEQLREVAIQIDAGEGGENLQESTDLMSLSALIISVDDLIKNVQAPDLIYNPWQRANFAHQETKMVLSSWLKDEADAFQVVEAMDPVIEDLRRNVGELEEALISEYGYDQVELDQERQAFIDKLNTDEQYAEIAQKWEGDFCFVIEADKGLEEEIIFYFDLWHGTCREGVVVEDMAVKDPAFVLQAPYGNFARVVTGELHPMQAMMTRKLHVKGNMAVMMRNVPTVLDFVRCAQEVTDSVV